MRNKLKYMLGVVLLLAMPHLSFAQYFQSLHDVDSSVDWGYDIFVQPDSSYFVFGTYVNPGNELYGLLNMHISADGSTLLSKRILTGDSANLFIGLYGEMHRLSAGGYIAPFTEEIPYSSDTRGWGGILKYDATGDTVFMKTYTDTSVYYDGFNALGIMPDNGYVLGGLHDFDTPSYYPGYIIRTDSMGDTLWTHTYQTFPDNATMINNVIPLPDSRIAAAAQIDFTAYAGPPYHRSYIHYTPWFLLIDSNGNVIRDTVYSNGFMVGGNCGELYNDVNGGYINIGQFDYLYTSEPSDLQNFPGYIAHLDTNFRVTWITSFPYNTIYQHRQPVAVRQLRDGTYVVFGDDQLNVAPVNGGWAAGISRTGAIMWCHTFVDGLGSSYLRDMAQTASGSLVFTGSSFSDSIPAWRESDVWLLGVDSNGCELPGGCGNGLGTGVAPSPSTSPGQAVIVWPNPTSGSFTVAAPSSSPQGGEVLIYDVEGQCVATYKVKGGATNLQLPVGISAGMYVCKYIPNEGNNIPTVVRLVYAP